MSARWSSRSLSLALVLTLALASTPATAQLRSLMSPGEIAKQHERVEDDCDACHLVFKGVPDEKCLHCHQDLRARQQASRGYHAKRAETACIGCHTDHRGKDAALTKEAALADFDHRLTEFPLESAHAKLECAKCHTRPVREMGTSCGGCHQDTHRGTLGARCQACHVSVGWKEGLRTLEEHDVETTGGHEGLACGDCHRLGEHVAPQVGCADCHERSHGGTKAACQTCHQVSGFKPAKFEHAGCTCSFPGKHRTFPCLTCHEGFKFTETPDRCSDCHAKDLRHEPLGECSVCHSALTWKTRFDHNKQSRFALAGEHLAVDCSGCHPEQGKFKGAEKTCEGCHAADGAEAHGDFGSCARCHTTDGFAPSLFDHASTGFALTGRHDTLDCQVCHAKKVSKKKPEQSLAPRDLPGLGAPDLDAPDLDAPDLDAPDLGKPAMLGALVFAQTAATPAAAEHGDTKACASCHTDPHRGTAKGTCDGCHTTEAWRPTSFDPTAHAQTRLPLEGRHRDTACNLCHVGGALTGLPTACASCHVDRHGGRFGDACTDCHSVEGFKPAEGFEHARTGFTLAGRHAALGCNDCHGGGGAPDLTARPEPTACRTCHELGHGAELGRDCQRCHADTDPSFATPKLEGFDHRVTGFALERRHRILVCGRCHPFQKPSGQDAGSAPKPRGPVARCRSCHTDPHGGQLAFDCAECHRPDRWRLPRFDHDRAGWPLRGRHFVTPCADCHTSQRWVGLTTDCYDCHALDAARARMRLPGPHAFGRVDCRGCHFSGWRWR